MGIRVRAFAYRAPQGWIPAASDPTVYAAPIEAPYLARNFRVHLDGHEVGFAHVSGLSSVTADDGHLVVPVVLRRGMTTAGDARELWQWHQQAAQEVENARRNVVVELLDEQHELVVARWLLESAWPTRWTGLTLDAGGTEVAMEEIELAYERLDWTE